MIKQTYALLDLAAQNFLNPLAFINDADAIRWFTTMVNDPQKRDMVAIYPEQYVLYRMMDFDDKIGKHIPRKNENEATASMPKEIIIGINVKNQDDNKLTKDEVIKMIADSLIEVRKRKAQMEMEPNNYEQNRGDELNG